MCHLSKAHQRGLRWSCDAFFKHDEAYSFTAPGTTHYFGSSGHTKAPNSSTSRRLFAPTSVAASSSPRSAKSSGVAKALQCKTLVANIFAALVMDGGFPLAMVEDPHVRNAITAIVEAVSGAKVWFSSRRTITRRVKELLVVRERAYMGKVARVLGSKQSTLMAFNNDGSTSTGQHPYAGFLGSVIERPAWKMFEFILGCDFFPQPHTQESSYEQFEQIDECEGLHEVMDAATDDGSDELIFPTIDEKWVRGCGHMYDMRNRVKSAATSLIRINGLFKSHNNLYALFRYMKLIVQLVLYDLDIDVSIY